MFFIGCGVILIINDIMEIELNVGGRGYFLGNGGFGGGYGSIGGIGYNMLVGGIFYGMIYELN